MFESLIPDHWNIATLDQLAERITDGAHYSPEPQDEGEIIANVKDMRQHNIDYSSCTRITADEFSLLKQQNCAPEPGDLLLSKDGTIGKVILFCGDREIVLLSSIAIIRLKGQIDADFIKHILRSFYFEKQLYALQSGSALKRIVLADIRRLRVPYPQQRQEQQKIAKILTTIDNLIEKTEALIKKYQAIKQGMMHDLFTRGIGADGQLRPPVSEAPEFYKETELGWIPIDWEVSVIDSIIGKIIDYRGKTPEKSEDGVVLITAQNVRFGYLTYEPREYISLSTYKTWMTRGIPKKGDILFTTEAPLGYVAEIKSSEKLAFAQRIIILSSNQRCENEFLKYLLMSSFAQKEILAKSTGSTVLGIKQSEFRKVKIALPKNTFEQKQIVKKILSSDQNIDNQIALLKKYKSLKNGLMQDLLTGKVRVNIEELEAA